LQVDEDLSGASMLNVKHEMDGSLVRGFKDAREEQLIFEDVDFDIPEKLLPNASPAHRLELLRTSAPSEGMRKLAGWILEG